jgi:hypothetical protein
MVWASCYIVKTDVLLAAFFYYYYFTCMVHTYFMVHTYSKIFGLIVKSHGIKLLCLLQRNWRPREVQSWKREDAK